MISTWKWEYTDLEKSMALTIQNKDKEIERLNNIINKAIELTENLLKTEDRGYYQILFQEQLKVLRGEDKE